ncbi:anti-sigma factor family protein [Thioalbus denitrificans]|uniref:Anti-sigma factor RsiW n=1 Tax=Thioalbus denitrificans TaxID=547122 RepID=A0A369CA18_9GAMM|nr:anti-sigma factor [Thioalbus denitrificans]RCX30739.1 anti-sigma factor RsiW [Thioalbus denitrificans]
MSRNAPAVTEADLHAYVDGLLEPERLAVVEAYLAGQPAEAERLRAYRRIGRLLHQAYDPVLGEPVPAALTTGALRPPARRWLQAAAAAALFGLGGLLGWTLHPPDAGSQAEAIARVLVRPAAVAHAVYSTEVRHPVEVGAEQEAHLTAWLTKRLGAEVRAPSLQAEGYDLVGGRLLPGEDGRPAAQFMYQDGSGRRLTLYLRTSQWDSKATAFRYAETDGNGIFYWVDGPLGYALTGPADRAVLLRAAQAVHHQLNP